MCCATCVCGVIKQNLSSPSFFRGFIPRLIIVNLFFRVFCVFLWVFFSRESFFCVRCPGRRTRLLTIALESLGVDVTHHSAHTITAELLHGQPLFFEVDGLRGVLKLFARLGARLLARLGFSFLGFFFSATLGARVTCQ